MSNNNGNQTAKEKAIEDFYKLEGIQAEAAKQEQDDAAIAGESLVKIIGANSQEEVEEIQEAIEVLQEKIEDNDGDNVEVDTNEVAVSPYKNISELDDKQTALFDGLGKTNDKFLTTQVDLYSGIAETMREDKDFIFTLVLQSKFVDTLRKSVDEFVEFVTKDGKYVVAEKHINFVDDDRVTVEFNVKYVIEEIEYREFVKGDYITFVSPILNKEIFQITRKPKFKSRILYVYVRDSQGSSRELLAQWFRHATNEEVQAKERLD